MIESSFRSVCFLSLDQSVLAVATLAASNASMDNSRGGFTVSKIAHRPNEWQRATTSFTFLLKLFETPKHFRCDGLLWKGGLTIRVWYRSAFSAPLMRRARGLPTGLWRDALRAQRGALGQLVGAGWVLTGGLTDGLAQGALWLSCRALV